MKTKKRTLSITAILLCFVLLMCLFTGCGKSDKEISAASVDYTFSLGEFNYFYYDIWKTYYATSYEYEQEYGLSYGKVFTGYDFSLPPELQKLTEDDFEYFGITAEALGVEAPTWADYFKYNSVLRLLYCKYATEKCEAEGIGLTEEQQNEIEKTIKSVEAEAGIKSMEPDEYSQAKYGEYVTIELLKNALTLTALGDNYYEFLEDQLKKSITIDELNEQYSSNTEQYNVVSYRGFYITDKEYAGKFTDKITDDKSFVNLVEQYYKGLGEYDERIDYDYSCLINNATRSDILQIDEKVEKWVFDQNRKSGDKVCIPLDQNSDGTDDTYYIAYMLEPEHQMNLPIADARIIQFNIDDDNKSAALEEAEKILKLYEENPTEEYFISLAKEYSDDENTAENGGLYEAVSANGNYSAVFTDWILDESRKTGNTTLLQVNDIYCIVYYVGNEGKSWMPTVKEDVLNLKLSEFNDELVEKYVSKFDLTDDILVEAVEKQCALIAEKI